MSLSQLDDDVVFLRSRLAERERELAAVREAATDAAEAAASRLHAAQQEVAALRCALDEALATAGPEPEPPAVMPTEMVVAEAAPSPLAHSVPVAVSAAPPRRSLRRAMVLPVWRLVRPVARPVLWRARSFLTADALRELRALRAAQEDMRDAVRDAAREAVLEALSRVAAPPAACASLRTQGGLSHGLGLGDTAAERWLLTVALESARA